MCSSIGEGPGQFDATICVELVEQMLEAGERILRRGSIIRTPEDFTKTEGGIDAMDGIIIMVIVLGESTKKLEKLAPRGLLSSHPEIDWKGLKGMRDVLSHEYFGVDPQILFDVTRNKVPLLLDALLSIKSALVTGLTS